MNKLTSTQFRFHESLLHTRVSAYYTQPTVYSYRSIYKHHATIKQQSGLKRHTWAAGTRGLAPSWGSTTAGRAAALHGRNTAIGLRFHHPALWERQQKRNTSEFTLILLQRPEHTFLSSSSKQWSSCLCNTHRRESHLCGWPDVTADQSTATSVWPKHVGLTSWRSDRRRSDRLVCSQTRCTESICLSIGL